MKKFLTSFLIAASLLMPGAVSAQVFSQSQVIIPPFPGVVMSTSTALGAKLQASTTPTVDGITATSSTASSSINHLATNQLSIASLSGILKAVAGYISTAFVNLASDVTGILPVVNGGTGRATFTSGQLLYGNLTNALSSVATTSATCSGSTSCSPFTVIGSSPITISSSNSGTVTSISGSGGTTGLTLTGGPITTAGTLTLGGILGLANGGTNSSTATGATTNLQFLFATDTTPVANTVARSDTYKMADWISVKDFGAVGNGTADDTTAIQNAFNFASTTLNHNGTVYFPAGTYKVTSTLIDNSSALLDQGATIRVSGTLSDLIELGTNVAVGEFATSSTKQFALSFQGGSIDGNDTITNAVFRDIGALGLNTENVTVYNAPKYGFEFDDSTATEHNLFTDRTLTPGTTPVGAVGIYLNGSDHHLSDSMVAYGTTGVLVGGAGTFMSNVHVFDRNHQQTTGFDMEASDNSCVNCESDRPNLYGVYDNGTENNFYNPKMTLKSDMPDNVSYAFYFNNATNRKATIIGMVVDGDPAARFKTDIAASSTAGIYTYGNIINNVVTPSVVGLNGVATGTAAFPYFTFGSATTTGMFLNATGDLGFSVLGNKVLDLLTGTSTFTSALSVPNLAITGLAAGCAQIGTGGYLTSTGSACGSGSGAVSSVSNSDSTLTISPTTGVVVASLNLTHPNTWTGLQQFNGNASSTQLTVNGDTYLALSSGSVGVGTTTLPATLSVSTGAQQSGTLPLLSVASTTSANLLSVLGNGAVAIGTPSTGISAKIAGFNSLTITGAAAQSLGIETTHAQGANFGSGIAGYSNDGTAMTAGSRLGFLIFGGSSSATSLRNSTSINGFAENNWVDGSNYGSYMTFNTTPPGSTTNTEHARLTGEGDFGIGTTSPFAVLSVSTTTQTSGLLPLFAVASTTNATIFTTLGNGDVGVGTSTPGSLLSIQGVANFTTATTTHQSTGGINLTGGGCFAINGTCVGSGGGSGTVTNVATDATLTGGPITTTGTLGLNLANSNNWTALQNFNTPGLAANVANTSWYGIGGSLLAYASTTNQSTIFGLQAGGQNATTSASTNGTTAVGFGALKALTTGTSESGFGDSAGLRLTTGNQNSFFGYQSGATLAQSPDNTFAGYNSGSSVAGGSTLGKNTAIGSQALSGSGGAATETGNTVVGYQAGKGATTASFNTLFGYQTGIDLTTGFDNIVLGETRNTVGSDLTTGGGNILIGYNPLAPSASTNSFFNIGNTYFGTLAATSSATALTLPLSGSFSIGSTSPFAKFSIQTNNGDTATTLFAVGSSTASATTTLLSIDNTGHVITGSPKGNLSSCGTTNSLDGNDVSGTIMFTGTLVTACTLTFANPVPANQNVSCQISSNNLTIPPAVTATSSTAVTFGVSSGLSADTFYYNCSRNVNN